MSRTIPSFAEEGLKRFLHGMDRRIRDLERLGDWRFDSDDLTDEELIARSGIGQVLSISGDAVSVASGGDYLALTGIVHQFGFAAGVSADGKTVTWPASAVGEIQVEMEWDTYQGGGTIELEIDGVVPSWGVLAEGTSGQRGCKRRTVNIVEGALVKVKVTQSSGSAQTCSALAEFAIPDPTGVRQTTSTLITDRIPERLASSAGETFFDQSFSVVWDGVETITLAGSADGFTEMLVDDQIQMDVTHADASTSTFTHDFGSTLFLVPAGPFDVTSYFEAGANTMRIRLSDQHGQEIESNPIWLVRG